MLTLLSIIGCSELGNKSEYGVLQEVFIYEEKHPIKISKVEIRTMRDGYILAGFRANNGSKNVWVLLNPKYSPYYKQMSQANYSLSYEDLDKIKAIQGVSDTVIAVLETRLN
jgi:hypothetical protein